MATGLKGSSRRRTPLDRGAEGRLRDRIVRLGVSFIHMPRADRRLFRAHLARRSAPEALQGSVLPVTTASA